MRGDPHSYQAIAHEDPGYESPECEECHEAEAVEWDSEGERDLCAVCFEEMEDQRMEEQNARS